MTESQQQNFAILPDTDALDSIPFGYQIELAEGVVSDVLEDNTDSGVSVPHILSSTQTLITLRDGTILADVTLEVDSDYPEVELRIVQGEEL